MLPDSAWGAQASNSQRNPPHAQGQKESTNRAPTEEQSRNNREHPAGSWPATRWQVRRFRFGSKADFRLVDRSSGDAPNPPLADEPRTQSGPLGGPNRMSLWLARPAPSLINHKEPLL
jgi:hypothetical protein